MLFKKTLIAASLAAAVATPVQAQITDSNINDLFAWAETEFPGFFPAKTLREFNTLDSYKYVFYPETGIYLAHNTADGNIYTLGGPWTDITLVGPTNAFLAQANITEGMDSVGSTTTVGSSRSISTGAFTEAEINPDNTLNSSSWTYGWTVNVHGNANNWTTVATANDSCPAGTNLLPVEIKGLDACELPATIDSNLTLTNDNVYVLADGGTRVGDGNEENKGTISDVTLTINPGTLVVGDDGDYLLITRNNMINAVGTAASPIVFRSLGWAQTGEEQRQSWGGIVLQGNGIDFKGDNVQGEGGVEYYAGNNNADNSGTMKYVVVTGAGNDIDGNGNELNALTLQGVGSETSISYIQLDQTQDDGIEFFGGAASVDHLVLSDIGDDAFDADNGWKGAANNVYIYMSETFSAGGPGESRGIEADGYDPKDASGSKYLDPATGESSQTTVMNLSNFTIVGNEVSDTGLVLRRAVSGTFDNFNVSGFVSDSGIEIRDRGTLEDGTVTDGNTAATNWAGTYNRLTFSNSEFSNNSKTVKISMEKDEVDHPANILDEATADAALAQWKVDQEANNVNFGD